MDIDMQGEYARVTIYPSDLKEEQRKELEEKQLIDGNAEEFGLGDIFMEQFDSKDNPENIQHQGPEEEVE